MPRTNFDSALGSLHNDLLRMGSIVEKQIHQCMEALVKQDEDLANQVIENDNLVDSLDKEIEDKCIRLIAKEQPLARDLRNIFTSTKLVTDLERMADYAVDIAKIAIRIKNEKYLEEIKDITKMAEIVQKMIKKALDAYVAADEQMAYDVCKMDDEIDGLYKSIFTEMISIMINDELNVNRVTQLLFVCKYLERIGDHVTNICEWTIYLVTGELKDLNE